MFKKNFGKQNFYILYLYFFYKLQIRIQGFDDQQLKKEIQMENVVIFFIKKLQFTYPPQGL